MEIKSLYQIKKFQIVEQIFVIRSYYKNVRFALSDLFLGLVLFFSNPYRTCRKFLEKKEEPFIYGYGEIPLREFEKLMIQANVTKSDQYLELGFGRGKTLFWVFLFIGCRVEGVEWVPSFVKVAKWISKLLKIPLFLRQESIFDTDLSKATVIYCYITPLQKPLGLKNIQRGAKLITISEPAPSQLFLCQKSLPVTMPWGKTKAYINVRI